MLGIYRVAAQRVASRVVPNSTLIIIIIIIIIIIVILSENRAQEKQAGEANLASVRHVVVT
jgi:hypothetical protein